MGFTNPFLDHIFSSVRNAASLAGWFCGVVTHKQMQPTATDLNMLDKRFIFVDVAYVLMLFMCRNHNLIT